MKSILVTLVISLAIVLIACSKDKFETKPRIEIRDYSSKEIRQNETLNIRLDYFDKEGDLDEGIFTTVIHRLNLIPITSGNGTDLADTFRVTLPKFTPKDKGEIDFKLAFDRLKESFQENDTLQFSFSAVDRAGNKSDTLTSDQVVIYLP